MAEVYIKAIFYAVAAWGAIGPFLREVIQKTFKRRRRLSSELDDLRRMVANDHEPNGGDRG